MQHIVTKFVIKFLASAYLVLTLIIRTSFELSKYKKSCKLETISSSKLAVIKNTMASRGSR